MRSPAARVLLDYLMTQVDEIVAGDTDLRDAGLHGDEDPIHDTRVATRRLRSTLRIFGKFMAGVAASDLDRELKWFAAALGDVRDCQVQLRRFTEAVDEMPDELVLGPVRSRIGADLQAIELPARDRLKEAMDSDRYQDLLDVLHGWRTVPPVRRDLSTKALRKTARKAGRKADRRLTEALPTDNDTALHRARKAAKRARYAAELCRPLDQRLKRTVKHYKKIQTVLGDHQDTVVAAEALRRMAVTAGTTQGENGFTYGLLYSRERQIARQSRRDARRLR
jgi:CHAD domain-containing protein